MTLRRIRTQIMLWSLVGGVTPWHCAAAADQLEEILVTASKRSESLQSVPMSISTFSSAALEQRTASSFMDYGTAIPNLAFAYTGDGVANARTVSIRGVSGNNTTGFYLDETPVPDSIDPRIVDIERIEVLRGPQGTLYGARSMGGTVRVITRQPDLADVQGAIHGGLSNTSRAGELNSFADGSLNLPIVRDRLALRVVGFHDREGGFFERRFPVNPGSQSLATVNDVGRSVTDGGALSVAWRATDTLTITPRVLYQASTSNGFPYADARIVPRRSARLTPDNFIQQRSFDIAEGGHDRWTLYSLTAKYISAVGELVSSTAYFDRDILETEDQTDFIASVFLTPNGLPPIPTSITEGKTFRRFVQEVRFASQLRGPFQFVAGAFYSNTSGRYDPGYFPPNIVHGLNGALGGALGTDVFYALDSHRRVSEPALFGEASIELTPRLKLTSGLRWYEITTTSDDTQSGIALGAVTLIDSPATTTERGVNPKFQLEYQIDPDRMTYLSVGKGFRPGGISAAVPSAPALGCAAGLAEIGVTARQTRHFNSDRLWNYEIGSKTAWLDNRLTVNGAVFHIDWQDIQQQILLPCGFNFTANAGAAKSDGFELEVRARPVASFDLSAGVGYQHAVITRASSGSGPTSPQKVGDRVFQVPDWTANTAINYTHGVGNNSDLLAGVTYAYVGSSKSANNDPFNPRTRPAYSLLEARIAFVWSGYEVALFGKNLTDQHANLADNRSISAEVPGRPRIVTNQPRTVGLEMRTSF